jgi:hypothetical protein
MAGSLWRTSVAYELTEKDKLAIGDMNVHSLARLAEESNAKRLHFSIKQTAATNAQIEKINAIPKPIHSLG